MAQYAFYSFANEKLPAWGVDLLPLPVRREVEDEVFGGEQVRVDLLLEELGLFLDRYPEIVDLYSGTVEAFTWMAAAFECKAGDPDAAVRALEMGLGVSPDNLLLRSNYALVLQYLGKGEEALEQYEVVLCEPEGKRNPFVHLMAARLYAEQGEYLEAYRLLDDMAGSLPADDAFWDFLAEMKELAGVEEPVEEPARERVEKQVKDPGALMGSVCPNCGFALRPDAVFCGACGKKLADSGPAPRCPSCGGPLKADAAFCGECGAPAPRGELRTAFCSGCGSELREGANFCRNCGKKV